MSSLDDHYAVADIKARIINAIRNVGLNPDERLTPAQLAALDHFHTGGYASSLALLERLPLTNEHRVLDIGAGLAGAARMLVAETGCAVDCIELSNDYCIGAELLNQITGLQERIGVYAGSALEMPFEDEAFDAAWMQNVGMNIADKQTFYSEVYRVLKPGGRFAFQELLAGDTDTTYFPLPWATVQDDNCLISADDLNAMLNDIGFVLDHFEDASQSQLAPAPTNTPPDTSAAPQLSLSAYVDDLAIKAQNAQRSLAEGQVRFARAVFCKL